MGHALQFANLGDEALPRARTCFATSSDREGWAVYLETEMAPHLSLTARASELRAEVELALGRRFRRCEYHDFLLGQGSIPFVSLRQLVFGELVAGARRRAA